MWHPARALLLGYNVDDGDSLHHCTGTREVCLAECPSCVARGNNHLYYEQSLCSSCREMTYGEDLWSGYGEDGFID